MQLPIYGERVIKDVQEEFSGVYPYLKIEFFRNGSQRQDRFPANARIPNHLKLKDVWIRRKQEGQIDLEDDIRVADLENEFFDQYGLSVQVFRKSGNIWLETTMTDNWTLRQQNEHGKEISGPGQ